MTNYFTDKKNRYCIPRQVCIIIVLSRGKFARLTIKKFGKMFVVVFLQALRIPACCPVLTSVGKKAALAGLRLLCFVGNCAYIAVSDLPMAEIQRNAPRIQWLSYL
jgi:hypothetical protein